MISRITKVALAFMLIVNLSFAQNRSCGTATVMQNYLAQHPEIAQQFQQSYQNMDNTVHSGPKAVRYIPVVFHVIYKTTAQNVSATLINQSLAQMNLDYRKQNSDISQVRSQFTSVTADAEIQFCLATVDPNGNATTGIVRTQTTKDNWSVDTESNAMKSPAASGGQSPWNFRKYLNVWIVDLLDYSPSTGGTAGYAYLPGLGPQWEAIDGIVVDYQVLGTGERTLTHECGHYLGLSHPWEDEQGNAGCTPGDGISDTPPTDQATFNCPASQTRCSGNLTQWENFMDYSSCSHMFTVGQANKMNNILSAVYSTSTGTVGRSQLTTWGGCNAITNTLQAVFTGTPTTLPSGSTVTFTDQSTGTPTSWSWTFSGGSPSSFNGQNPPAITYNTPGTYTVTLTVSNATGTDTQTSNNYITVTSTGGGTSGCDTLFAFEGLYYAVAPSVSSSFAFNKYDVDGLTPDPSNFMTSSAWSTYYTLNAPGDTNYYQLATSWFSPVGQANNWLIFGPLQAGTQSSTLSWKHLMVDNTFRDGYRVLASTTGGAVANFSSPTVLKTFTDNDPLTAGDTTWRQQSVNLPSNLNGQQVYLAFHHNATDMNILGLDEFVFSKCDASTSAPVLADFVGTPLNIPVGSSVQFTDLSTGNPTSWNWTFNGGTPSTFVGQNPPAITYNAVGNYTVSLTVSNGGTPNTKTNSFYVHVTQTVTTTHDTCFIKMSTDFSQTLVNSLDFPNFNFHTYDVDGLTADPQATPLDGNFQILYTINQPAGDTNKFLAASSWFSPIGQANNWFTFGPLTPQHDTVKIFWKHRYFNNNFRDAYSIVASPAGFTPANMQLGQTLFSVSDNDPSTANDTVWRQKQLVINAQQFLNTPIYLGIHHTGNDQLAVLFDDILIEDCDTVTSQIVITNLNQGGKPAEIFTIIPNPSNGEFYLNYQIAIREDINIEIRNALGQLIYINKISEADGGMLLLPLQNQASGIYFAQIQHGNKTIFRKLIIQK